MKKPVAQFNVLFAVLKLAAAAFIATVTATSAFADTRINLNCTLVNYSPSERTPVRIIRYWVPAWLRIEISDSDQVSVYLASGTQFRGEVKRENTNKIAMEATREVRDDTGQETFMTYTLEWFKSNNKIFVSAFPQGYNALGTAKGTCKSFPVSQRNWEGYGVSGQGTPGDPFSRAPDKRVCNMATENGAWQQRRPLQKWVAEARDRGLTPEDCVRVLKAN